MDIPAREEARLWLGTELGKRVLSALVMVSAALLAAYQGGWAFSLFWLAAGIICLREWLRMSLGSIDLTLLGMLGFCLAGLTASRFYGDDLALASTALGAGAVIALLYVKPSQGKIWALGGFLAAAILTKIPPLIRDNPDFGFIGLIWMFSVVWTTDTAAFFTGRALGGPKLWPSVSPKKTWSGFFGGLVGGALAGFGIVWAMLEAMQPVSFVLLVIISVLASLASQAGDLAESAMKRLFNVKDAGHLIPGHGGLMDRLDGFFAVALFSGFLLLIGHLL